MVTVFNNLTFLIGGYHDDAVWHQSRYFLPLTGAAPYLTAAGAVALGWRCIKERRPHVILIVAATIIVPISSRKARPRPSRLSIPPTRIWRWCGALVRSWETKVRTRI